jgi:hypothetical protein
MRKSMLFGGRWWVVSEQLGVVPFFLARRCVCTSTVGLVLLFFLYRSMNIISIRMRLREGILLRAQLVLFVYRWARTFVSAAAEPMLLLC